MSTLHHYATNYILVEDDGQYTFKAEDFNNIRL